MTQPQDDIMTPTEAIAALGGPDEVRRIISAISKHNWTAVGRQELECISALALHALTDSWARGALSRVRELTIAKFRMIDRGTYGWSYEAGYPGFIVEAIDRELATLPTTTSGLTQAAPLAESSSTGQDTRLPRLATAGAGEAGSIPADSPTSPGLSIAETEDWMGKLCDDPTKVDKEVAVNRSDMDDYKARWQRCKPYLDASTNLKPWDEIICMLAEREKAAIARADAAEAELARLRAEAKPHVQSVLLDGQHLRVVTVQPGISGFIVHVDRGDDAESEPHDEVEPEAGSPMQFDFDRMRATSSAHVDWRISVEQLLLWCVRKLGGARG